MASKPLIKRTPRKKHTTMIEKWNLLRQSELETFNKIIYGKLPADAFDEFVASWNANGGEQVTKEVNEWFQSVTQ
ncbi:hypothetical protein ACX1C1_03415 [Paenibacillus sp. strain BS8-2]